MREDRPGSTSPDPAMCLWRGSSFDGRHAWCSLAGAWTNCLEAGCFVTPDGGIVEYDNSPAACAKRLRRMGRER